MNAISTSRPINDPKEATIRIPMVQSRIEPWITKLVTQAVMAILGTVIAMVGFWLLHGRTLVTADEVKTIVQETAPYVEDRKLIAQKLDYTADLNKDLKIAIDNNTSAITDLKTAIAVLAERLRNDIQ